MEQGTDVTWILILWILVTMVAPYYSIILYQYNGMPKWLYWTLKIIGLTSLTVTTIALMIAAH
jgi:hypothetical protein